MSSTIRSITNNAASMYNVLNKASSAVSGTASKIDSSSQDYKQNLLNAFNNSQGSGGMGGIFGTSGTAGNSGMNNMFKLAADFSSYNRGGFNVAMNALRNGFSGRVAQNTAGASASAANASAASGTAEKAQNIKLADSSQSLSEASVALTSTGANSLFKADANGNYDMDALKSAVGDFVNAYNDTRSAVLNSNNAKAISTEVSVVTQTSNMQDQLGKIGITVNSDNTLSLDAEKFASADIGDIKSMFNGTGSYAYSVGSSAENITSSAVSSAGSSYRSQSAALSSMRTSAARSAAQSQNAKAAQNDASEGIASKTAATQAAAEDVNAAQTESAGTVQAAGETQGAAAEQAAANQAQAAAQTANASPYFEGEQSTGTIVDLIA